MRFHQTSVMQEGLVAAKLNAHEKIVSAMHDITEGGVLGAVYELAAASGNGVLVEHDKLPIGNTQRRVCALFDLDPCRCIGAGAMLLRVKRGHEQTVIDALAHAHIPCTAIGRMCNAEAGMQLVATDGTLQPLTYQARDPYWAAFFLALQKNWP